MLLTSVFAKDVGLIYGEYETMLYHLIALVLVALFSFVGTYIILKIVDKLLTLRVKEYQEEKGLDLSQHGENI